MELITASWQLDLGTVGVGGLRLLAFSDLTQGEPKLVRNFVEESPVQAFRAPAQSNRPGYNLAHTLTVSRVVQCDSDADARAMLISFTQSLPTAPVDLTIFTDSADLTQKTTLAGALVQPGYSATTQNDLFQCELTIVGGALT